MVDAISGLGIASERLRATYLASSMAAFGVAAFIGSNLGGQIVQNILGGSLQAIRAGLMYAGVLRVVFGLLYLTLDETSIRGD